MMHSHKLSLLLLSSLTLIACGGSTQTKDDDTFFVPAVDENISDDVFDDQRRLQVYIKMPADDFSKLRAEGRALDVAMDECPSTDFEYTDFKAIANIDGEELTSVAIRKKGYLGSLSAARPSIKLNFDTHQEGRTYKTLKRMTLNNDRQDPSHSHQCMAYELYRAAGIIAPRCNLAHVVINNEDMGTYTHVESIKKPFLERNFNNKSGNLYEAQIADLGSELNHRFELKTNKTANDRSDLDELAAVLQLEGDEFLTQLAQHLDIDEFITYWAVETLIGHWDSATGNTNNFYLYHNPEDDLFHFIPWGTDSAFTSDNTFKPQSAPLYKNLSLAKRLYDIEQTRNQYFNAIITLLTEHWVEEDLLAKLEQIQVLTQSSSSSFQPMKDFILGNENSGQKSQRELLTLAMAGEIAQTSYLLPNSTIDCNSNKVMTNLTAQFESQEDNNDEGVFTFTDNQGIFRTASMTLVSTFSDVDSLVYQLSELSSPAVIGLTFIGAATPPLYKDSYVLQVFIEKPDYQPASTQLHGIATNLLLFKVIDNTTTPAKLELISVGHSGTIELSKAGSGDSNNPIEGRINAEMAPVRVPNYIITEY
jgi:spore coat protein H